MSNARLLLALSLSLFISSAAFAQKRVKPGAEREVEKSPLTATLIAKKDKYKIPEGQRGKEFAEAVSKPDLKAIPEPPAVDLVLELKNETEKAIVIIVGSDAGALDLKLDGPGAVTVQPPKAFTREFRGGKKVEIAPGKTHEIPIMQLMHGLRGLATHSYWTEPGEYTITATLRWPAGDPLRGAGGRTLVEAVAEPIKVTVE
jgi:hypothetical protein